MNALIAPFAYRSGPRAPLRIAIPAMRIKFPTLRAKSEPAIVTRDELQSLFASEFAATNPLVPETRAKKSSAILRLTRGLLPST